MASLVLSGDTSGSVTLAAPAVAGSTTQTLVNVSGTLAPVVSGTAVTASSTSVDFTSIPSWVKRVTVMFNGVSTNGSSVVQIQIGSGSVSTSGYRSTAQIGVSGAQFLYATTGFIINTTTTSASLTNSGMYVLTLIGSNTWVGVGNNGGDSSAQTTLSCAGSSPALGGALDRVRVTTVNGTDTFDAGTINILYE